MSFRAGYPGQAPNAAYQGQQPGYGAPQHQQGQQPGYGAPQHQQGYGGAPQYQQQQAAYGAPPGVSPEVMSWFRAVDQDNSGYINAEELSRALQSGNNRRFSVQACSTMMGMFDHSCTGRIDMVQFSQLYGYINQWTEAFKRADSDNSGSITVQEMMPVLQQQGYNVSPQTVQLMVQKFGSTQGSVYQQQKTLGLDGFILVNSQLRKVTEVFRQKDTQQQGRVTLSYEEFVAMVVNASV